MRQSVKGALLSGLVLPGLGQLVLKAYVRGAVLIAAVLACLYVVVSEVARITAEVLQGGTIPDSQALAAQVNASPGAALANAASLLLLALWIGAVIDAFVLGRKLDRQRRDN